MWITLNSFIWNIKTMKHKPSTKSDSYKCRIIRLLKMNRLYWKTTVFFSSLNGEADTQNRQWNVNMIMPFTRSKSYLTARRKKKKKKRKEKKRKSEEKQKKMERRYSSDNSLVSLWQWLRPGFKGLLWLVRTNKAVWEHSGAAEWQPLVPIIVKSCCLGTHIHTATNVHIQH